MGQLNREVCEIEGYVPLSAKAIIINPARYLSYHAITGARKRLMLLVRPPLLSQNRDLMPTNNIIPLSLLTRAYRSM
jgi:hypothetical protein